MKKKSFQCLFQKPILIFLFLIFLSVNLYAQKFDKQKKSIFDRDPFAANHAGLVAPIDDLFDLQFEFPVAVGGGEAGIETDGNYIYTTKWNGTVFYKYELDGTYIEEFSVTGCPGAIRDLAYDGQYFYGAAANYTVYEMDFDTQTVISTITAPIAVRAIAYDEENDGFWANNWSDQITLFDRTGTTLDSFPCGVWESYYGFAWDGYSEGGPYLWGYAQDGYNDNQLVQFDIATGLETGVNFDVSTVAPTGMNMAGGLCISDAFVPAYYTICGLSQNNIIWGLELFVSADPLAPGVPANIVVTPAPFGELETNLEWICPTLQINGDPLSDLDEMRVYRGNDLIYTDTIPTIGATGSYTDLAVPIPNHYTYRIVGFNDYGEGLPVTETVWVGEDVPDAVTDLILTDISAGGVLVAQLDWVNPTTGFHSGYFTGVTGYDITRSDGVQFLGITGPITTWQDCTIVNPGYYSYTVTPFNDIGYGPSTTTPMGPWYPIIQVGNTESTDYQIPMNIWFNHSIVECVYDKEWISTDMLLSTISFHANVSSTDINSFNLEIWLGEIDINDLSGGWIDATQLTMVFDGTISVTAGDYWLDIPLDNIFEYTYTHNLVMGIVKDDDEYYSTADAWWTTESGTDCRSIHKYSDSEEYSIQNPPYYNIHNKTSYPDVRFHFPYIGHGDVTGVVTDSNTSTPIEGVEVWIGSWGPVFTNSSGEYTLYDVVAGIQLVTADKEGYYTFQGEIEVLTNQVVNYNIALLPNDFGGLDGTVTDADTGNLLEGAEITAVSDGGYFYDAVTNADGYYTIADVVAETYDISCSFPNYPTQTEENVVVVENAVMTVDFAMEGYSFWNDFETNDGGFISNNASGWQWGAFTYGPMAGYSGTNGWGTVIGGDYPAGSNFTLDSPIYYIPEMTQAILEFWHWYDTEPSWDGGNVKVSTDGGATWSVIDPITGYTGTANTLNPLNGEPIFTGHDHMQWENVEFDLSDYSGQSIYFRWHFGSDGSVNYPGWYIDDFSISSYPVPDATLEGTVTQFGTGTPIEGATVSITNIGLSDITQADGTYEIPGIWSGFYNVTCIAPLFLDAEVLNYNIISGVNILDFSLLWSEILVTPEEITITLPPDTTDDFEFNITNNGPGDLVYSITVEYTDNGNIESYTCNNARINCKSHSDNKKVCEAKKELASNVTRYSRDNSDETWLGGTITNNSGIIPGNGGSVIVEVMINSDDLIAGEIYTANLVIHNNSNYGGDFILPVTLIVENVNAENKMLPLVTKLIGNYPNPFNPTTTISFSVAQTSSFVSLEIYNLKGQKIKTLDCSNSFAAASKKMRHSIIWNGTDDNNKHVSSGIYLYKLETDDFQQTRKMIMMK